MTDRREDRKHFGQYTVRYGKRYYLYQQEPMRKSQFDELRENLRGGLSFVTLPAEKTKTSKRYWVYFRKTSVTIRREKTLKSGLPLHIRLKDHRAFKEECPPYSD